MVCDRLCISPRWLAVGLLALQSGGPARAADAIGPPTIAEELASFRLADPGLTIELVAAEPNVLSPVAMAWDAEGRLFVAEMIDYPVGPKSGQIRQLEDRDGDGVYERSTVFAAGLPFPSGILPYKGGVFVTAAPHIWYFRDQNGDGKAEEQRIVLTGFVEGNQQLRVNGLTWGWDNWVYGANGRSGGAVRRPEDPVADAVAIDRHDFRFRPDAGEVEAIAGFSQFGLPRDDWGDRFPSWNTIPIRHVVIEERVLSRNPFLASAGSVASILDTADGGRVYSLAPQQTRFNAESVAFFNASCGPAIYRDDVLGSGYRGNAFVCEPLTSLVHRRRMIAVGPTFLAKRVEQGNEFLASTHSWFRPVNLATGPDGALYVADFCRALVEHPAFVPEKVRGAVDFHEGHDRGRIWRIRPKGDRPPPQAHFANATPADLVGLLGSPNAWWRDTAQRLMVERNDHAVVPRLKDALRKSPNPLARVHAMWTLVGLNALGDEALVHAVTDIDPHVREQAVRLAASRVNRSESTVAALSRLADDPSPRVRFQLAIALGDVNATEPLQSVAWVIARDALLAVLIRDVNDSWTRLAILSGLGETAWPFLLALRARNPAWVSDPTSEQGQFLSQLASVIGARGRDIELAAVLQILAIASNDAPGHGRLALLAGLSDGLKRAGRPLRSLLANPPAGLKESLSGLVPLSRYAREAALSDRDSPGRRVTALEALTRLGGDSAAEVLVELLRPAQPQPVQSAAARGLSELGDAPTIARVLEGWGTLASATRRELIAALLRSNATAAPLLDAIEHEKIAGAEIDPAARESLRRLPDAELRRRAEAVLKNPDSADRRMVIDRYTAALDRKGDPRHGAELFQKNCQTCHQRQGQGHRVGPDLSGIGGRPREALLSDILDPSKEVAPDYVNWILVTKQGEVLSGLIAEETPTSIRLRRAEGVEESVLRVELEELRATSRSLMPEGLEQALSVSDVADLLSYLRQPIIGADRNGP